MSQNLAELERNTSLTVVTPRDGQTYEKLRRSANHRLDKHPLAIVRCRSPRDVQETIRFARAHDIRVSPLSGGHGYCGDAMLDGGITIDLRALNAITVDARARRVRVQAGARTGAVLAKAQKHNLVLPVGSCSDVGISGFALGGGYGDLGRSLGLCCDSIVSMEVVSSEGELFTVDRDQHPDLFWALRGAGGGHFVTVVSFTFELHPMNKHVPTMMAVFKLAHLEELLSRYIPFFAEEAPDELHILLLFKEMPGLGPVAILAGVCNNATVEEGTGLFEYLMQSAPAEMADNRFEKYLDYKIRLDGNIPAGKSWYPKSTFLKPGSDPGAIAKIVTKFVEGAPTDDYSIYFAPMGGRIARGDRATSAFAHRDERMLFGFGSVWDSEHQAGKNMRWTRDLRSAIDEHVERGVYVNEIDAEHTNWQEAYFGANYDRLRAIKKRYDPIGLFLNTAQNLL